MYLYTLCAHVIVSLFYFSSRLQPDHYRRLLGSTKRARSNLNTSSSLTTIDREPSPLQHTTNDDDSGSNSGDGSDSGDMGESGERGMDMTGVESSGIRHRRGGRVGAREGGRELGEY